MTVRDVTVDIGQDNKTNDYTTYYRDKDENSITLNKRVDPYINDEEPLKGYKLYEHRTPHGFWPWEASYKVGKVKYREVQQNIEYSSSDKNQPYIKVTVIYWKNDESNEFPLLLGLHFGIKKSFYTKKDPYYTNNDWEPENSLSNSSKTGNYKNVLDKLNTKFKDLVVVNLKTNKDESYCGHPSLDCFKAPKSNSGEHTCAGNTVKFPAISVKEKKNRPFSGYTKFKHSFKTGKMRLFTTYGGTSYIPFKDPILSKECKSVSVYYGSRDDGIRKPLLLEVPVQENSFPKYKHYTLNDGAWKYDESIKEYNLAHELDELNCRYNSVATVDISQKTNYCCKYKTSEHKERVFVERKTISMNIPSGYELYEHRPNETPEPFFNGNRFRDGSNDHRWPGGPIIGISKVFVYFSGSDPILISVKHSSGHKWFKRRPCRGYGYCVWTGKDLDTIEGINPEGRSDAIYTALKKISETLTQKCTHPLYSQYGSSLCLEYNRCYIDKYIFPDNEDLTEDFDFGTGPFDFLNYYDHTLDFSDSSVYYRVRSFVESYGEKFISDISDVDYYKIGEEDETEGLGPGAITGISVASLGTGGGLMGFGIWKLWPVFAALL
ncbi:hypothetical protein BEWA_053900 [Theileria equi strain WA]|uniref:Uncharacterized protein n=1 Tax=Theileria equi strain WA TaxID=1537102 RepID=L1LDJ1_THEEQ|nr:hypothetical protein BEWA_053900 [Theileria equi strain WA]EKX73334.1 hypothetical protein BEWA_053900 [Theileria equi strain WA]|eukprot:XP_004832786.1 hypothetical protein BEWA_053900 [Theileria equi strain WA]